MKRLQWILLFLVGLMAFPCLAQESLVVEDEIQDVVRGEEAKGLDISRIVLSRKGASKIGVDIRMHGAVPRTAIGDYVVIVYLDIDDNGNTGKSCGSIGTDLNLVIFKIPGSGNWECKVDKTSTFLAGESFQVVKFNQYKDGFSIDVSAPWFKKPIRLQGYTESISSGKVLDRAPAETFFTWNEADVKAK